MGLPASNNVMADHHFREAATKKFYTNANVSLGVGNWLLSQFQNQLCLSWHTLSLYATLSWFHFNAQSPNLYPYSYEGTYYWEEQVIDNILNFNKDFGKHSVTAMVGSSITTTKYTDNRVGVEGKTSKYYVDASRNLASKDEAAGFLDPSFSTIDSGAGGTFSGDGTKYKYNRASFFGRVNYSFAGKYLLQATMRYDGSSSSVQRTVGVASLL